MTRYLLDTTALIDFSKGREPARSRILQMVQDGDDLAVCAITVAEFYAGIHPEQRPTWDEFLGSLQYSDITLEVARQAGCFRYDFARRGIALSIADTLIAALAKEIGAVLVTDNIRDYPLEGIRLLSLRE